MPVVVQKLKKVIIPESCTKIENVQEIKATLTYIHNIPQDRITATYVSKLSQIHDSGKFVRISTCSAPFFFIGAEPAAIAKEIIGLAKKFKVTKLKMHPSDGKISFK